MPSAEVDVNEEMVGAVVSPVTVKLLVALLVLPAGSVSLTMN
ncbi:MAG: hypothetical protein MAG581_02740 [Deltaproteobacteria bacterium]|nr:hypothetical protein [Deltaproteobacteria bacterium]